MEGTSKKLVPDHGGKHHAQVLRCPEMRRQAVVLRSPKTTALLQNGVQIGHVLRSETTAERNANGACSTFCDVTKNAVNFTTVLLV